MRGFTLVELLVVIAIMVTLMALALSVPSADRKRIAVEASARELAATLRQARSMAIERRSTYAVAFNVANGAGSSGQVLNNWDGGHWYQILGPVRSGGQVSRLNYLHPEPILSWKPVVGINSVLAQIDQAWLGERSVLPARKVRFLALSDVDNGHLHLSGSSSTYYNTFPGTYPRPWCGWYDTGSKRLYGWGAYRSGVATHDGRNPSGFFYQGTDAAITGSRNVVDRISTITGWGGTLLATGEVRPIANARWLDSYLTFRPDGSVVAQPFGQLRLYSYAYQGNNSVGGNAKSPRGDLGDLAPRYDTSGDITGRRLLTPESSQAGHYLARTGYAWITLAPDAEQDSDVYPSAAAAVRAMMPAVRVGINQAGDVRIEPVRAFLPTGTALDAGWISSWGAAVTDQRYQGNAPSEIDGTARGTIITDALVPEMLTQRCWWTTP